MEKAELSPAGWIVNPPSFGTPGIGRLMNSGRPGRHEASGSVRHEITRRAHFAKVTSLGLRCLPTYPGQGKAGRIGTVLLMMVVVVVVFRQVCTVVFWVDLHAVLGSNPGRSGRLPA